MFVGDAVNNFCEITSISETTITCTVPRMHSDYSVGVPYTVVVTGRILEESYCRGTCSFTYVVAGTPIITPP